MCGIVGMAGNLNSGTSKMFRDMLVFSQVRGMDSTGAFVVPMTPASEPSLVKEVGTPSDLFASKDQNLFDALGVLKLVPKVVVGHTRAATIGDTTKDNAHPFQYNHIFGVHNGSLITYKDLCGYDEHEVDSKAIFHTIAEKGIEYTWKSFYGAACLVYWDQREKLLHIIRNDQRPLALMQSKNKDAFFWASEEWMITVAAGRNRVELDRNEAGKPVTVIPEPDTLYTYEVGATSFTAKGGRKLEKRTWTSPTTTQTHGYNGGLYGAGRGTNGYTGQQTPIPPIVLSKPLTISTTWAHNLTPAPKEIRGSRFMFITLVDSVGPEGRTFYVVGEMCGTKERVEVYPTHKDDYQLWTRYQGIKRDVDSFFEITHRPRVKKWGNINCYRISSAHVKLVESIVANSSFRRPGGAGAEVIPLFKAYQKSVSEAKWREIMKHPNMNGGCSCCCDPIPIEDHDKVFWHSEHFVLCQTCEDDPTVKDTLREYMQA